MGWSCTHFVTARSEIRQHIKENILRNINCRLCVRETFYVIGHNAVMHFLSHSFDWWLFILLQIIATAVTSWNQLWHTQTLTDFFRFFQVSRAFFILNIALHSENHSQLYLRYCKRTLRKRFSAPWWVSSGICITKIIFKTLKNI